MISPLVRRCRLAVVFGELLDKSGLKHEQLAAKARVPRTDISRIVNATRKPDVGRLMKLLEALGVAQGTETWSLAIQLAQDANEKGWWDAPEFTAAILARQRRCADVESGSRLIRQYHSSLMPWMLQTPEFIAAYDEVWRMEGAEISPVQGAARLRRQAAVLREDGPPIEVVLEEQMIRRPLVDAAVWAAQLRHLVQVGRETERISIRVLTVESAIGQHSMPLIPFGLHVFDDPDDGVAMLVTTHNDDLLVYDQREVLPYVRLFDRLRDAAMSDADTAAIIEEHAARLAAS